MSPRSLLSSRQATQNAGYTDGYAHATAKLAQPGCVPVAGERSWLAWQADAERAARSLGVPRRWRVVYATAFGHGARGAVRRRLGEVAR